MRCPSCTGKQRKMLGLTAWPAPLGPLWVHKWHTLRQRSAAVYVI